MDASNGKKIAKGTKKKITGGHAKLKNYPKLQSSKEHRDDECILYCCLLLCAKNTAIEISNRDNKMNIYSASQNIILYYQYIILCAQNGGQYYNICITCVLQ
uniref:Uncharacterized protein n=1 Tax=Schizaphis graminum TaxID=13262 RepID=A0A2S2P1W4_SCHGA